MRFLIRALVVVVALVMLGWMSFSTTDDSAAVTIETKKVVDDTQQFVDEASETIDSAIDNISGNAEAVGERAVRPDSQEAIESE